MIHCKKIIFTLLLCCSIFCNAFETSMETSSLINANKNSIPGPNDSKIELNKKNTKAEIDSIEIYHKLIDEADAKANYAKANKDINTLAFIGSGALFGLGIYFFISAATYDPKKTERQKNNLKNCNESSNDACPIGNAASVTEAIIKDAGASIGDATNNAINVGSYFLGGVISIGGGIAILVVNYFISNKYKRYEKKRDAYQQALDRYKAKKRSMKFIVTPTMNLLNASGGIRASLQF